MESVTITMIRSSLAGIPIHPLPAGFLIRWYRPGNAATWVRIQTAAETSLPISRELFDREFAGNELELSRRQAFLVDPSGREIGTATAWFQEEYHGRRFGRIHWVAIIPERQGWGLAKPLLSTVCKRLVELGHDCAYLVTGSHRLPAIQLYRKFGFEPEILSDQDRLVWPPILTRLAKRR